MSTPPENTPLPDRVRQLEEQVADLQRQVARLRGTASPPAPADREDAAPREPSLTERLAPHLTWESENWLNRIGIALLLFGLAFLFKYTVDQGWITPLVRVLFGLGLGAFLLVVGVRLRERRRALGQVLEGGGVAVGYATAFAAYQLYGLVAYPLAFTWMVAVTGIAFVLSVRQRDQVLAVIGVLGGLGTPFLLYTDAGSLPGLIGYTCLILAGAAALYARQRWRGLLATAVGATWLVLGFAYVDLTTGGVQPLFHRSVLQAAVGLTWLVSGLLPLYRRLELGDPAPTTRLASILTLLRPVPFLVLSAPLIALVFTQEIWTLRMPEPTWHALLLAVTALYGALHRFLRRLDAALLASTTGTAALLLAVWLCAAVADGAYALALTALVALGATSYARGTDDAILTQVAHGLFGGVALRLAVRFVETGSGTPPLWHLPALAEGAALAAGAATQGVLTGRRRLTYGLATHVLLLAWLYRLLVPLPEGQAYVSVAWAAYALALLVAGVIDDAAALRTTALATIVLLVAKLFLVDMAQLAALWRILVFLGLGTAFLVLSYYLPGLFGLRDRRPDDADVG